LAGPYSGGQSTHRHPLLSTCMIPLKMRRLFFGFTPRRLLGINGSILAHCPSLNQNKFARICWPPIRLTNPLNLNMVNWVLTLVILLKRLLSDFNYQYPGPDEYRRLCAEDDPMGSNSAASILDRILDTAADNLRIAKILVQMGL